VSGGVDVELNAVSVSIESLAIVRDVSIEAAAGTFTGLLGPNGSGKSTLLRTIYRSRRPATGTVLVDGRDVWCVSTGVAARLTAVVAQEGSSDFDFTVREVVEMGRNPHKRFMQRDTVDDEVIVAQSLNLVGLESFAERTFATLSGGEKQRVLLARCLAQQAPLLVLDEPTNHLDVRAQFELLDLIGALAVTTVAALHDLNLAARYCDRVVVLDRGRVVASGVPVEVLTEELIAEVFGVRCRCELSDAGDRVDLRMIGSVGGGSRAGVS